MLNRSPPVSRKQRFVNELERLAEDDQHGYSQKPPSGRWGPDFDCSSLVYQAAENAGYSVGTGSDKVRFTGTMLKDFEKAGFQILPFANVGISDLEIGDILLNLALHAEVYVGEGQTIAATGSETGTYSGKAGDQTGHEIEKHPVTTFTKKWDYVLRPPEDQDEEIKEGGDEMPMPYGNNQGGSMPYGNNQGGFGTASTGYNPMGMNYGGQYPVQGYRNYPQQGGNYPQQGGNLGQMNGYSGAGNQYPSGPQGSGNQLIFVKGIEGANNRQVSPGSTEAFFDEDDPIMYIKSVDNNGYPNMRVFHFEECSEEMPQHLSPLMQHTPMGNSQSQTGNYITRDELMEILKETFGNESSSQNGQPTQPRNQQQPASNPNGGRNSNRSN